MVICSALNAYCRCKKAVVAQCLVLNFFVLYLTGWAPFSLVRLNNKSRKSRNSSMRSCPSNNVMFYRILFSLFKKKRRKTGNVKKRLLPLLKFVELHFERLNHFLIAYCAHIKRTKKVKKFVCLTPVCFGQANFAA